MNVLRRLTVLGSLLVVLFLVAPGCTKATNAEGVIEVVVQLGEGFDTSAVSGLNLRLDAPTADGGLSVATTAASELFIGGHRFSSSVTDCDGDGQNEFCVEFPENPFSLSKFTFVFRGSWAESTWAGIGCEVLMQSGGRRETVFKTAFDDGSPLRFIAGQTRRVTCDVACRAGYSCAGSSSASVTLTGTSPSSPSNNRQPRVKGTVSGPVASVSVFTSAGCTGAAVGSGSASLFQGDGIELAADLAANETTTLYARGIDTAENNTACTTESLAYRHEDIVPAAPTSLTITPAGPANDNTPVVRGAAETDSTVRLYTNANCTTTATGAQATSATVFAATGVAAQVADDSTTTFYAQITDLAGNISACALVGTYVEDSTVTAPTGVTTAPTSPANDNQPRVRAATVETGSAIEVFVGACDADAGTPIVSGTAAALAGDGLQIPADAIQDNATVTLYVRATDSAGNRSACVGVSYVEDSTLPVSPTGLATSPVSPANDNRPFLRGAAEGDAGVEIYTGACGFELGGTLRTTGSAVAFGVADGGLQVPPDVVNNDTATTFYVAVVDPAGNRSGCASIAYTEDSTPPVTPWNLAVNPTSPGQSLTPTISGKSETSTTIKVFNDYCGGTLISTPSVNGSGDWSFDVSTLSVDGAYRFYARAVDAAGNESICASIDYVRDSVAPSPAPTALSTNPASPATSLQPYIRGTNVESGATVEVFTGSCGETLRVTGTAAAFIGTGIQIPASVITVDSTTTFYVRAKDAAGNPSTCASVSYERDETAPVAPTGVVTNPASYANDNRPYVKGTAESGSTVQIFTGSCGGTLVATGSAADFALASIGLQVSYGVINDNTSTTLYVRAVDAAGNASSCATYAYVEDSLTPSPPGSLSLNPASPATSTTPTIRGSGAEDPGTVKVYTEFCRGALQASATSSTFNASGVAVPGGVVVQNAITRFYLTVTDPAGNESTSCSTIDYTNDLTPPTFAGAWSAVAVPNTNDQIVLTWDAGADGVTAASAMVYEICQSPTAETCLSSFTATYTTDAGATAHLVPALTQNTRYQFAVRARDQAGQQSDAGIEVEGKTGGPGATIRVAAGQFSTCTVMADGTGRCWGTNWSGQAGDGTTSARSTPAVVSGLDNAVAISVSYNHSCAVLANGKAKCWGLNDVAQLGSGLLTNPITAPVPVAAGPGPDMYVDIGVGNQHTCALKNDGVVRCWGRGYYGQLGNGGTGTSSLPGDVLGLSDATGISVGPNHSCALRVNGGAACWGKNTEGQLGDGTTTNRLTPVDVTSVAFLKTIAAGDMHTCGVHANGTASCWGKNTSGQLGDGTTTNRTSPVAVAGLSGVVGIAAGSAHTCARLVSGLTYCWGDDSQGQLGNDVALAGSLTPVVTSGVAGAIDIAASSGNHSCALLSNGTVRCWGDNASGQLGDNGAPTDGPTPVLVAPLLGVEGTKLISPGMENTCAVQSTGRLSCWGWNGYGQVGDGTTTQRTSPVTVSDAGIVSVVANYDTSCAVTDQGAVYCWGWNNEGQIGDGTKTNRSTPTATPITDAIAATTGGYYSCALRADGTVKCWGNGTYGELGNGTTTDSLTPVDVSGLTNVKSIWGGSYSACALVANGTIKCWGSNFSGQVGDGTTTKRTTPVLVSSLASAKFVTAGSQHSCAVTATGLATCWGENGGYQLGDQTGLDRTTPVSVVGIGSTEAKAIIGGATNSCALLYDGTVKCWGQNDKLQLGDSTNAMKSSASGSVVDLVNSKQIQMAETGSHACAVLSSGDVRCWGDNWTYQLGDGTTTNRNTAVRVLKLP